MTQGGHNRKQIPAGTRFRRLTVRDVAGRNSARCVTYLCECDCGVEIVVSGQDLRRGHSEQCKKCGQSAAARALTKDWTGDSRNGMTVIRVVSRHCWEVTCQICGDSFTRSTDWLRGERPCPTCNDVALHLERQAEKLARQSVRHTVCTVCGGEFSYTHHEDELDRRNCSHECYEKRKRTINAMRARAREHNVSVVEPVDAYVILERDNWICRCCGVEAPRHLRGTGDPLAPEVDHIIPLDMDGPHTEANCQCVHRKCNRDKREKIETGEAYHAILALPLGSEAA